MGLQEQIDRELKEAIREKNEHKRDAIRMLLTAIKVKEKELRRALNDTEIQQIISTQIKQRRDSSEQFGKAGRIELARKEEDEIGFLQAFLPEMLSSDELEALIDEAISESGAKSQKEMGKVMKALMPKVSGRAEGKLVNELVRKKLPA